MGQSKENAIKIGPYDMRMRELGQSGPKISELTLGSMTWGTQNPHQSFVKRNSRGYGAGHRGLGGQE